MGNLSVYEDKMIEAFVQKPESYGWYKMVIEAYRTTGGSNPLVFWSWWGFFGNFWFLVYRKAYNYAILFLLAYFIAGLISNFLTFLVIALAGVYSNYFLFKTYDAKKQDIEAAIEGEDARLEAMYELGGFNQWVVYLAVITFFLQALLLVYATMTYFMP